MTQPKTIVERTRVKHNELIIIGRGTSITGGLTCGGFMIATAAGSSLRGKMFFIRVLKGASVKSDELRPQCRAKRSAMFAGDAYKLLEGTADAAFVVTPEGEICFWNTAAEQLFGYSAADVLNKTCYSILKGEDTLGTFVCMGEGSVQHCAAHGRPIPSFDLEVTTRSGQRIWVSISTIVFEDSRLHRQLIAHLARDISSRKQVEQAFLKMIDLSKEVISVGDHQSGFAPIGSLSEQEKRILRLFANAKNSRQVAQELGITLPTLRNHLHAVNQKLRTHNRLEAVLHAMKRHLL